MSINEDIINNLSCLISRKRTELQSEIEYPVADADTSDDLIKKLKRAVEEMTRIRGELEDVFYGGRVDK